jgi:hypothetical protein
MIYFVNRHAFLFAGKDCEIKFTLVVEFSKATANDLALN